MDELDRKILNAIQSDFPIAPQGPTGNWGNVSLCRRRFSSAVKRLKEEGVIRRIGGNFHSGKLDFRAPFVLQRCRRKSSKDLWRS
jgi:siroheme decarboxylase